MLLERVLLPRCQTALQELQLLATRSLQPASSVTEPLVPMSAREHLGRALPRRLLHARGSVGQDVGRQAGTSSGCGRTRDAGCARNHALPATEAYRGRRRATLQRQSGQLAIENPKLGRLFSLLPTRTETVKVVLNLRPISKTYSAWDVSVLVMYYAVGAQQARENKNLELGQWLVVPGNTKL